MAQILDELLIKVLLDNKELQASAKKMEDTVGAFAKNIESTLKSAFSVFAAGFGLNFAKNLAESFIDVNAKLGFLSQTLHTNVRGLNLWQEAYKRAGGTAEGFNTTITGIFDKLNQAQLNQDPKTLGILNILGVSPIEDGKRKDVLKVYEQTVNALHKLPYGTRRSLAQQLGFDDAGIRLIDKTSDELQGLLTHLDSLGVSSEKRAAQAQELRNKWLDIQQEWGNIGQDLVSSFMPQLEGLSNWAKQFVDYLQNNKTEVKEFFDTLLIAAGLMIAANPFAVWAASLFELIELIKSFKDIQVKPGKGFINSLEDSFSKDALKNMFNVSVKPGKGLESLYTDIVDRIAPGIKQIESSGGKYTNTGNGAYGDYQIRPNWGNKARLKEGLPAQPAQWYLDPKNNYDTYKLMMRQNLQEHGGNLNAAIKEYSGGNYGLKAVQNVLGKIPSNANLQSTTTSYSNQQNTQNTQASIHVGNLNLPSVAAPQDFINKMVDMTRTGYTYSSGVLA